MALITPSAFTAMDSEYALGWDGLFFLRSPGDRNDEKPECDTDLHRYDDEDEEEGEDPDGDEDAYYNCGCDDAGSAAREDELGGCGCNCHTDEVACFGCGQIEQEGNTGGQLEERGAKLKKPIKWFCSSCLNNLFLIAKRNSLKLEDAKVCFECLDVLPRFEGFRCGDCAQKRKKRYDCDGCSLSYRRMNIATNITQEEVDFFNDYGCLESDDAAVVTTLSLCPFCYSAFLTRRELQDKESDASKFQEEENELDPDEILFARTNGLLTDYLAL